MSNNHLSKDKQIAVAAALAEGNSIRSIERMTGVHRDTIMRLGVRVGQDCARLLDEKMRGLDCNRTELDEIWGYIGKKMAHVREDDGPTMGDVWTLRDRCGGRSWSRPTKLPAVATSRQPLSSFRISNHVSTIAFRFPATRCGPTERRLISCSGSMSITRRL